MDCGCKDNFIPFNTRVQRAFVTDWDFYSDTPWMPAFGAARVAARLLAEQGDGLDVTPAVQTASFRFDKAAALDDWSTIGTVRTNEGDSDPEDISPTVTGKFWMRFGHGIRKASGAASIGVASVGLQWSFPTERLMLLVAPHVINAYDNPVGEVYTELLATDWMSFVDLQEVEVAYESFDSATDFRYTVVLQSVKTDPSQQAPDEDEILSPKTGDTSGTALSTSFTNASANKAQLCRIVLKADNNANGSALKRGRVYLAVSSRYA